MEQPNRNYTDGTYRYGFQGQEKDDELKGKGNSVNYKYRMHDSRLGRFFAPDPLEIQYPFYSSYQFSGNRLIDRVELEGLEPKKPSALATELPWYMPEVSTWTFYAIDNRELTKVHESKGITWEVEKIFWTSHDIYPHLVSKSWIEYNGEVYDATSLGEGATIGDLVKQKTLDNYLSKLTELQSDLNSISEKADGAIGVASLVDGVKNIYKGWKAIKASKAAKGISVKAGDVKFSKQASDALFELGTFGAHVSIRDGVGVIKIGFSKTLNKSSIALVEEALKSNGATSMKILTGTVKPKIKSVFNKLMKSGKKFQGFTIEKSINPLHDFKLTKSID